MGKLAKHFQEIFEVIFVEEVTISCGMRRDHLDSDLEWSFEDSGILIGSIGHWDGHFSAGMGEERESRLRHFPPKFVVAGKGTIHILTVGE